MDLQLNQIVELRRGNKGVVAGFNNQPFLLVFTGFTSALSRYNEDLKHKNRDYDIVRVFDGSSLANVNDVFKARFSTEGLPVVWESTAD